MTRDDFKFLKQLKNKGVVLVNNNKKYSESIYESNIPYRPGVYLVYSIDENGEDNKLLYYGKAGVTENKGKPMLNFHQLPKRLVATTNLPQEHPDYKPNKKKYITRAKLWPWYVSNIYKNGIKIYWYVTEWPQENPNKYEKRIKSQLKEKYPNWEKTI